MTKKLGVIIEAISKQFNLLPKPVKVSFYVCLNGITLLLVRDLEALKGVNEYIDIIIMMAVNILTYLALNFKSKAVEEEQGN